MMTYLDLWAEVQSHLPPSTIKDKGIRYMFSLLAHDDDATTEQEQLVALRCLSDLVLKQIIRTLS